MKLHNSWLRKNFIYGHESLNNYLFKEGFKKALDKSAFNYKKQLILLEIIDLLFLNIIIRIQSNQLVYQNQKIFLVKKLL